MHLKRWITGLLLLPVLIYILYRGGVAFAALIAAAGLVAMWEYYRIVFNAWQKTLPGAIPALGLAMVPILTGLTHVGRLDLIPGFLAGNLLLAGALSLRYFGRDPRVLEIVQKQLQGVLYIPVLLVLLIPIRQAPQGFWLILTLVFVVFAGDTMALYVGTFLGRHKLCPTISPKKTVEGALGGLGGSLMAGLIMRAAVFPEITWGKVVIFSLIVGAAGQIGDLFESQMKRASGIKDSGGILPGHGGMLDRIDALLFAGPVAYGLIAML
ncbi:MAG: phosphatidate cytidylyltransferase [Desulfobacterales bacterium]